jgi:very-short-patch-repair endonuclease
MREPDGKRTSRARSLRYDQTQAEAALWRQLRNRQIGGCKFVRREPIGSYYVDFVCRARRLIVEVDGGQHADSGADRDRDCRLAALGYRVVRFWNNEVLANLEGVIAASEIALQSAPHPDCGERESCG